jgi:circadian clock protein KaiB
VTDQDHWSYSVEEKYDPKASTEEFEEALQGLESKRFLLRLYISGQTSKSLRAIENIERICQEHLQGRFELEIIDLKEHPERAEQEQILAAPTLIKQLPPPLRKFIGDMTDTEQVLLGLNILPNNAQPEGNDKM